jgi:hypothetical protein
MLVLFNEIHPAQLLFCNVNLEMYGLFCKKKKAIQFPEDVTKSEEIIFISQVKKSHSKYSCQ